MSEDPKYCNIEFKKGNYNKIKNEKFSFVPSSKHELNQICLSSDGIDRRIKAPNNCNEIINGNIGRLIMKFKIGKYHKICVGTAFLLDKSILKYNEKMDKYVDIQYALTAAHNLIHIDDESKKKFNAQNAFFQIIKNNKITNTFNVIGCYSHKNYFINGMSYCGYDIALIEIEDKNEQLKNIKHFKLGIYEPKNDKYISVIGFPGKINNKNANDMYGMNGTVDKTNNKNEKLIKYNDIDTSKDKVDVLYN